MNEDEGYERDEEQAPEDRSFIESAEHRLNGVKLHAFSPEWMWAADSIGLRYGRLSKEATDQFIADGTYPGMAGDVPIVMYVCSLQSREMVSWARRNPIPAEQAAADFAEKHRIVSPKQSGWWDAYKIFIKIMNEIHAAYGERDLPEAEKKTETVAETIAET